MKKTCIVFVVLFVCLSAFSQNTITGTFPALSKQRVKLMGFDGFNTYTIDSVTVNEHGQFVLSFGKSHHGMGALKSDDNKTFSVILTHENIQLKGETFAMPQTIEVLEGAENKLFARYASEQPRREQTLSAWGYLEKIYNSDSLFSVHATPKEAILAEKQRIKEEDSIFRASLNPDSYVRWFLPVQKLVSSVSTIAQYRTDEIPATLKAFRDMDYTDARLHKSGLLRNVLESHFWLLENSGKSRDSMYQEMQISIDRIAENLFTNPEKLNPIAEHLFTLLEKHSLFRAAEYLALKMLNQKTCPIESHLANRFETYRNMKIGNTAPDILFNGDVLYPSGSPEGEPKKLSDLKSKYTVVVFGAGWCSKSSSELREIAKVYAKWKTHGVEVLLVSLDNDKAVFTRFAQIFPFISFCTYQKWETPAVKEYHVSATPQIILLDNKRKIVLRPNSVRQMDSWVDWYLVQGNK